MPQELQLDATFYSREETQCHLPKTEIHGLTLQEALDGKTIPKCAEGMEQKYVDRLQCAVDPQQIPLDTEFTLRLSWMNDKEVPAQALDIGGDITGGRIDIFVDTADYAIHQGHQQVTAILDGEDPGDPDAGRKEALYGSCQESIRFRGNGSRANEQA